MPKFNGLLFVELFCGFLFIACLGGISLYAIIDETDRAEELAILTETLGAGVTIESTKDLTNYRGDDVSFKRIVVSTTSDTSIIEQLHLFIFDGNNNVVESQRIPLNSGLTEKTKY